MQILLTAKEEDVVTRPANGSGGPNSLFRKLRQQFDIDTKLLSLTDQDIQRIYNYAKPHVGGFQDRCIVLKAALDELKSNPVDLTEPIEEVVNPGVPPPRSIFSEGAPSQIEANRYERNSAARKLCLKHHGYSCQVCGITLSKVYGAIADNFIHVHHIIPLASIRASYTVDPILHLRPVCPNCHSILHRRQPTFSIQELSILMAQAQTDLETSKD